MLGAKAKQWRACDAHRANLSAEEPFLHHFHHGMPNQLFENRIQNLNRQISGISQISGILPDPRTFVTFERKLRGFVPISSGPSACSL
jgi:hypothetical protein